MRDRALHGHRDIDLGRRRRHEGVLLAARKRNESQSGARRGDKASAIQKDMKGTRWIHDNAPLFSGGKQAWSLPIEAVNLIGRKSKAAV
jgi:hypothetical protein